MVSYGTNVLKALLTHACFQKILSLLQRLNAVFVKEKHICCSSSVQYEYKGEPLSQTTYSEYNFEIRKLNWPDYPNLPWCSKIFPRSGTEIQTNFMMIQTPLLNQGAQELTPYTPLWSRITSFQS